MKGNKPADKCIFCLGKNGEDLKRTKEHILPKSWGGNITIKDGTCVVCQKIINETFEQKLAREAYLILRSVHNIKNSSNDYPQTIEMKFFNKGSNIKFKKEIDISIAPISIIIPFFCLPPFYTKIEKSWPNQEKGRCTLSSTPLLGEAENNQRWKKIFNKNPYDHGTITAPGIAADGFIKFLYKISVGFCWIVDPRIVENSNIREKIIGSNNINLENIHDIYSSPAERSSINRFKVKIFNKEIDGENHIFCSIRLFSNLFPEFFCDMGIFEDLTIEEIFEG